MITFKSFLNENINVRPLEEDSFIKLVRKNCSDYLSNSNEKNQLYRGEKNDNLFFRSNIRLNRRPKNTNIGSHTDLDNWFNDRFGYKYRSGALFCFNEYGKRRTEGYGNTFNIFPMNGYKLCGSKEVSDLWLSIADGPGPLAFYATKFIDGVLNTKEKKDYNKLVDESSSRKYRTLLTPEEIERLKVLNYKILEHLGYFESVEPHVFKDGEIMVRAPGYYGFRVSEILFREVDRKNQYENMKRILESIYE